ncbi:MAG: hypothetical protein J6U20_09860 [Fibrobacter sp.]|nr:hypothetical protein [Fibrobacter sp.]
MNKVLYNIDQRNDTTDAQKQTARDNIGAASSSDVSSAISNAIGALDVTDTAVANKFVTAVSEVDGKIAVSRDQPAIADVSGLQDALDNIPRPKNGVLTIQKNGTQVATFSADQSSNATANITVPTKTSELTNDSGFITEAGAPKEIEYVENTSTFADIKAIVDAGKLPVYKVDTIPTGPSGYYRDRYMMTTYHYSESQGKSATFSGTAGNTIKTYKIDGTTNQWTITSMTVPDSLGAGNGIDILANTISAKVKTGGGLGVDSSGLYLADGVVLVTKNNTFAEIKALYDAGRTPLLTYTIGSGNNISYCYSLLEGYFEVGGVKGFDFVRVAGTARTVISRIQDNIGWLADTVTDLQYELTDGYGIAIDSDTNTISAEVDTDYGLSLAATGIRVKVNGSDALEVNRSGLAVKEGSITYQKLPKNIMMGLIGSDDNDQNSVVTAKHVTLSSKSNRRLCYVNLLEAAQVLFMEKDASADHAHQIIHVDFEANVEPYLNYANSSTQFQICAVATNMNNPNYVVDPTQEATFVFGSDFMNNPRKNHISASFNIDTSQMTATYITSDPELCIICDATSDSIDTRGLLFSNIRVSGFVFADR